MENFAYENLDFAHGSVNLPGIKKKVYYIQKKNISAWPQLPATPADAAAAVTYEGDFTLEASSTFKALEVTMRKSPVTCEPQGEVESPSFLNKATFSHPGTEEEATAFAAQANRDDLVYLVETKKGKFRVIGNEIFRVHTKASQNIGASPTDEKGTTLEVEVTDIAPAPFYTGSIMSDDGDINPPVIP